MLTWNRISAVICILWGLTSCTTPIPEEKAYVSSVPSIPQIQPQLSPLKPSVHKIGLLLPLSGPHVDLGKELFNAAELSLFEAKASSVVLYPYDIEPDPSQAADQALKDGVELLIGPIFAPDVQKIKPLLSGTKVNLLCFSTDQTVAGKGIYLLGVLPHQQIERSIPYLTERGIKRIAAITPTDSYGKVIDSTLQRLAARGDIVLLGTSHYSKTEILEGRAELASFIKDIETYKNKGLEALFIPEGGEVLDTIVRRLGDQGSLQLIGSGQWDAPEMLALEEAHGGVFASIPLEEWRNFETRFRAVYGNVPSRIAGLAYDAVALAVALEKKGYTQQALTIPQGFLGTTGLFRLTSQGLNERQLAVLKVEPSGFISVSPAAQAF